MKDCFCCAGCCPAVAMKPVKLEGEPEVPVVPSRLAVHKKRPWWAQAARVVVGTAAMAVAGAAGAAAAKHHQVRRHTRRMAATVQERLASKAGVHPCGIVQHSICTAVMSCHMP